MRVCHICTKGFSHKVLFRLHLRCHFGEGQYACEVCGKRFCNESNMILHQALHNPYKCELCDSAFPKHHRLRKHQTVDHSEIGSTCKHCGAAFASSMRLETHVKKCASKAKLDLH